MTRKKNLIVFEKLQKDPAGELKVMLADLEGRAADQDRDGAKPARWNRRFAASGKNSCKSAPLIRPSY